MSDIARPFLVLYVVRHPESPLGDAIEQAIFYHFRRSLYDNVTGGAGLSVIFRFANAPGSDQALPIDLDEAESTAIIVLADQTLLADPAWVRYVRDLAEKTDAHGLNSALFPVAFEAADLAALGLAEQALRWFRWPGDEEQRRARLLRELTYAFCRMLRYQLASLDNPTVPEHALDAYLRKVPVFLSHSKHDGLGETIAKDILARLNGEASLSGFFDVYDIPPGLRFNRVLLHQVRVSAMIAIHTDTYSSREWCRQEILEAKWWHVPLIVANCLSDLDERGFPYMGNVPIVRFDPPTEERIDIIIGRLLDEVLKDFLWRCQVRLLHPDAAVAVCFVPRPPELITLAQLRDAGHPDDMVLVYPDPRLGAEEERLFAILAPQVRLRSLTQWLAEAP